MVYGLNRFEKLNPTTERDQYGESIFQLADKDLFIEDVAYAISNDDQYLFEYCIDNADSEILQESVKDVAKTVVTAIGAALGKIKDFVVKQFKKFKEWLAKLSFKTNDDGDLTEEPTSGGSEAKTESAYITESLLKGKWTSLYDLAGVKLTNPIKMTNGVDLVPLRVNNCFDAFSKLYKSQMTKLEKIVDRITNIGGAMSDSEFEEFKSEMTGASIEALYKDAKSFTSLFDHLDMGNYPDIDEGECTELTRVQISNILRNSTLKVSEMENQVNRWSNNAQKKIEQVLKKVQAWANGSYDKSTSKVLDYALREGEKISEVISSYTINLNIALERSVQSAVKIRRQLENELYHRRWGFKKEMAGE